MNRMCRPVVCIALLLLPMLAVGWTGEQQPNHGKQKGKPKLYSIGVDRPICGQDNQNDKDGLHFTATGKVDPPSFVYGLLFDPDFPLLPRLGVTDPDGTGADGTGADGSWVIQFGALETKNGYLLRVVDDALNSQDCVFNIVDSNQMSPLSVLPLSEEVQTINGKRVTKKVLRVRTSIPTPAAKYIHAEMIQQAKKKVIVLGKVFTSSDQATSTTNILAEFTDFAPNASYKIRVGSNGPRNIREISWNSPAP